MSELASLVALGSAEVGALYSCIRSWYDAPDNIKFSKRKLISALISSGFTALGLVNISSADATIAQTGFMGLIIANMLLGYGIDKLHSSLDSTPAIATTQ